MRKSVNLSPFMSSFFPITFSLQASQKRTFDLVDLSFSETAGNDEVFVWGAAAQ